MSFISMYSKEISEYTLLGTFIFPGIFMSFWGELNNDGQKLRQSDQLGNASLFVIDWDHFIE